MGVNTRKAHRRRPVLSVLVVLVVALSTALTQTTPALALPEGRHYEMVSPVYKGGYGVFELAATAMAGEREGEGVVFKSAGHFAGQPLGALSGPYLARRSAAGWVTTALLPPQALAAGSALNDISSTLKGLYVGQKGPNGLSADQDGNGEFFLHDLFAPDEEADFLTALSEPSFGVPLQRLDKEPYILLGSIGSDKDFCHVVFGINTTGALLPEASKAAEQLYEVATGAAGCVGGRALRLVAVANQNGPHKEPKLIDPSCKPEQPQGAQNPFNVVAAGGSEIFFWTEAQAGCETESNPRILYVRLNGEKTVEISKPIASDCTSGPCTSHEQHSASFAGANEAGTRVFFTTTRSLVNGDIDSGNDLYMAQIGCPSSETECEPAKREVTSLVQVSHDPTTGEAAEVQGVSVLSSDGSRVYFVARGALSAANGEGATPVKGADNLYVYDSEEESLHFVADLCSGPLQSGEMPDTQCPGDLTSTQSGATILNDTSEWEGGRRLQTTKDGRFLLFTSYGRLVSNDTDSAKDVYRYDAQAATLKRVSIGEEGYDTNGNGDGGSIDAAIPLLAVGDLQQNEELAYRAISEDGTRVVFETAEPLSSKAINGLINAYEWHIAPGWSEGRVSLVSSGEDEEPVGTELAGEHPAEIMMTPSGRDIFFKTVQGLSSQDGDGVTDVYDARLGAGFAPEVGGQRRQCEGDTCQGGLTNPAPLLVPGSVPQAPGENLSSLKPVVSKRQLTRAQQLVRALKACSRRPRGKRAACRHGAHKRYALTARTRRQAR